MVTKRIPFSGRKRADAGIYWTFMQEKGIISDKRNL
jgi:hypothetical protein